MSYEQKYIKYKIKYLKLNLLQKTKLYGGSNNIISWPSEYKKINQGDYVEIVIDEKSKPDLENKSSSSKSNLTTKGKVRRISDENIELYDNKSETLYNKNEFKNGINLKKIDIISLDEQINLLEKKSSRELGSNKEHFETLKKRLNELNSNKEQIYALEKRLNELSSDKGLNSNKEQIENLKEKINKIDNKLENHYHILPTSGIKQFEEAHPYFNKKID